MKQTPPYGNRLAISILTNKPLDAGLIQKTISHVYPAGRVTPFEEEKGFAAEPASLLMVDTEDVSGKELEHLLEQLPDLPLILVARDFAEVRPLSRLLSGRRAIVTRADLMGMGLIQAVHHLLERQQLHEQLKKTAHHLKELSIRDDLTHLINHRHFNDLLATEVKKSNRYKRPLALVIAGIKNFTAINETRGHHEGDRVLAMAAEVIRGAVREVDMPARYGDNEFAVILPESDEPAAKIVAGRIHESLTHLTMEAEYADLHLIISCGVAALSEQVTTKEELLRTALGALSEAKRNGQSSICTSTDIETRRQNVHENRQLIEQLHERLARLSCEAQRNYFQSIMKAIAEIPVLKKLIMPHSDRVAFFAQRLAESIGLDDAHTKGIHRAGLLHDTGKLAISAEILTKPQRLTSAEWKLIEQHPTFAIEIIGKTPFFTQELGAILHHHERYDGEGYPEGLAGDAIPLGARIIAITEAWDTMTSPQPYRPTPLALDFALEQIKEGSGRQFDPELVERFTSLIAG